MEIADAFISQYNAIKGIHQVTLTTAIAISDDVKKTIEDKSQIQFKNSEQLAR